MKQPAKIFSIYAKQEVVDEIDRTAKRQKRSRNQIIIKRITRKPWHERLWAFCVKN